RSNDYGDTKGLALGEYVQYMLNTKEENPYYLRNWEFENVCPELMNDYEVPEYFKSWHLRLPPEIRPRCRWVYIGPANSGSGMHVDTHMTSAWNAVVSGKKYWLFYPPGEKGVYNGAVDAFNPDLEKFPLFACAKPQLCIQNPGDIVFTPSGWWHQVINEQAGISITENFVNESNYRQVKEYLDQSNVPVQILSLIKGCIPELFQ